MKKWSFRFDLPQGEQRDNTAIVRKKAGEARDKVGPPEEGLGECTLIQCNMGENHDKKEKA
jgi:hypothetical protein